MYSIHKTENTGRFKCKCLRVSLAGAHPAVKILALLGLPHPLDIVGEDAEKSTEHGIRLGSAGVFGKEAVHDGGTLDDEPGNVLQRARGRPNPCQRGSEKTKLVKCSAKTQAICCDYQSQVIMRRLLLHWCMLG